MIMIRCGPLHSRRFLDSSLGRQPQFSQVKSQFHRPFLPVPSALISYPAERSCISLSMKRKGIPTARLTTLPYDILFKILSLVLPALPPRVRLTLDTPAPSWLKIFHSHGFIIFCPPILLVCRLLTRHSLRILYTHTRLSVHAGRSYLAQLSRLRAKRYIQRIDLALESQAKPYRKEKDTVCLRHEISSFYSPAYLVDLLHRIFPRTKSIHLTIVETESSDSTPALERKNGHASCLSVAPEITHFFDLASFTQSGSIDPAIWNDLIKAIRYKIDAAVQPKADTSLWGRARSRGEASALIGNGKHERNRNRLLEKFRPLGPSFLPNLAQMQLYITTCRSFLDDPYEAPVHHRAEQEQIYLLWSACSISCGGSVKAGLFRTMVEGPYGKRKEVGWEPVEQHLVEAISLRKDEIDGKCKGKGKQVEGDAYW